MRVDRSASGRVAVAPISIASTPSAISSPAPGPTMPTPRMRSVSGSRISFVRPSVRSSVIARPEAPHGNFATRHLPLLLPGLRLGQAAHASSGSVNTTAGIARGSNATFWPAITSTADAPFVRRLVREHRLADDVADGEDRRLVRARCSSTMMKPRSIDLDARAVEAGNRSSSAGGRPRRARGRTCPRALPSPPPSNVTRMPSASAFMPTTFVFSSTPRHVWLDRASRGRRPDRDRRRAAGRRHLDDGDGAAERGVDACRARGRCSRRRRRAATSGCRADRARRSNPSRAGSSTLSAGDRRQAAIRSPESRARTAACPCLADTSVDVAACAHRAMPARPCRYWTLRSFDELPGAARSAA